MDTLVTLDDRTNTSAAPAVRPARAPGGISIALAGSGGSGVMTAGTLLLEAAAQAGCYGLMVRTSGPQIRGGEAAALVRIDDAPVHTLDDGFHLLLAIDWLNIHQFADEIPLVGGGSRHRRRRPGGMSRRVQAGGTAARQRAAQEDRQGDPRQLDQHGRAGPCGHAGGTPPAALHAALRASWKRDEAALEANLRGDRRGGRTRRRRHALGRRLPNAALRSLRPRNARAIAGCISGNEAAGYGAMRGGIRFVAAYPITPATELLEWMAPALTRVGGALVQAEDELASINMVIGASYGGVPSLTATAGPGLALMAEGIGLAVSAEIPIVVVDVMRGGPSTGIPAKSEQSDLVVRRQRIARRCAAARARADVDRRLHRHDPMGRRAGRIAADRRPRALRPVHGTVARRRRSSDRRRVGGRVVSPPPRTPPDYKRYRNTPSGVSPMAIPGTPGTHVYRRWTRAHRGGIPTSQARAHALQLDKRARKLDPSDYGAQWADIEGDEHARRDHLRLDHGGRARSGRARGARGVRLRLDRVAACSRRCCPDVSTRRSPE